MKLLINASTLSGTGVIQVATSFILECINIPNHEYYIIINNKLEKQLNNLVFPKNFNIFVVKSQPLYGLKGFYVRSQIRLIEKDFNPDIVFTVFGPSWIKFSKPSVFGYAYPHYVYPDSPYFKIISLKSKIKILIFKIIHKYFLLKHGDYFICETEDVRLRLAKYFKINEKKIFTISNTYNSYFKNIKSNNKIILPLKKENEFRFLCLFSFQDHKNILILNKVTLILKNNFPSFNIKFILTINTKLFNKYFSEIAKSYIYNLDYINVYDCPLLYKEIDASFVPTLLECFTANYPESMLMEKPILTSDLSFARELCGNSALYFDPLNDNDITLKIIEIIKNFDLRNNLISNGIKQLNNFETPQTRAIKYINILNKIITNV